MKPVVEAEKHFFASHVRVSQRVIHVDRRTKRKYWQTDIDRFVRDLCCIGFEIQFLELCTHPVHHSFCVGCCSLSTEQQAAAVILALLTKPHCANTKLITSTHIQLFTYAQTRFVRSTAHSWRWFACAWLWLAMSVCAFAYLCIAYVCVSKTGCTWCKWAFMCLSASLCMYLNTLVFESAR